MQHIIKYPKGYLVCDHLGTIQSGTLVTTPAQATCFDRHVRAMQAFDRFNRVFGKGEILTGESQGHIVHKINMAEGNYVNYKRVSKLHERD